jgi:glycosyltransferase involved in cell wall biosynthesis
MISVIIPTLNDERTLVPTLAALVPAVVDGIVQEAILSDGGSSDDTRIIADAAGVQLIDAPRGRAAQLEAGAALARGDWLLFLPAGTALEPGWAEEVHGFIERVQSGRRRQAAAFFRFALDDDGFTPRLFERLVQLRGLMLAMPHGDQGMLISRKHYERLRSVRRRPKRSEIVMLKSRGVTNGERYQRDGYFAGGLRNTGLALLNFLSAPARALSRLYS